MARLTFAGQPLQPRVRHLSRNSSDPGRWTALPSFVVANLCLGLEAVPQDASLHALPITFKRTSKSMSIRWPEAVGWDRSGISADYSYSMTSMGIINGWGMTTKKEMIRFLLLQQPCDSHLSSVLLYIYLKRHWLAQTLFETSTKTDIRNRHNTKEHLKAACRTTPLINSSSWITSISTKSAETHPILQILWTVVLAWRLELCLDLDCRSESGSRIMTT